MWHYVVLELLLAIFACYLPVYLFLLFFLKLKVGRYNPGSHVVSFLATARRPWDLIFNVSTFVYGFMGCLILPISIITIRGVTSLNIFIATVLFVTGLATAFVGVFPMTKNVKIHGNLSYLVFGGVVFTGTVFIYFFNEVNFFNMFMKLAILWIIGLTALMAFDKFYKKVENSILEWITLVSTIIWIFLLSLSLLMQISMVK